MALTAADVALWKRLREMNAIPERPVVLEIGQANWFGDVDPSCLKGIGFIHRCTNCHDDVTALVDDKKYGGCACGCFTEQIAMLDVSDPFAVAERYYRRTLDYSRIVAIDQCGTERALKWDLNRMILGQSEEFCCDHSFDIVINSGTLEHIFNTCQAFQTIHDCCKVGGLMIHAVPVIGWLDHGFYCIQPTLFRDLASANGYEILLALWWDLETGQVTDGPHWPANWMLHTCLKKTSDAPFKMPQQGRYATSAAVARESC